MKKYLIITLVFSVSIFSCSKDNQIINGIQIYDILNEPIYLSIDITAVISSLETEFLINNCTIKNGKLFLSLPEMVNDIYLDYHPLGGKMSRLEIINNDSNNSYIVLAKKHNDKLNTNEIAIVYYNQNASLIYPSLWDGNLLEINFKKGWNIVNWYTGEIIDDFKTLYDNGYKWYIIKY